MAETDAALTCLTFVSKKSPSSLTRLVKSGLDSGAASQQCSIHRYLHSNISHIHTSKHNPIVTASILVDMGWIPSLNLFALSALRFNELSKINETPCSVKFTINTFDLFWRVDIQIDNLFFMCQTDACYFWITQHLLLCCMDSGEHAHYLLIQV